MPKWEFPPSNPDYSRQIDETTSETKTRVTNQHVVSRVVLKGFSQPNSEGKSHQLTPFDLELGREMRACGLRECGKVRNFLTYASASAEELWGTVETKLDAAIKATRKREIVNDPDNLNTIKDAIALHYVRSERYKEISHSSATKARDDLSAALQAKPDLLHSEFRRRHKGLHAAGPEGLSLALKSSFDKWQNMNTDGMLLRNGMEHAFHRVRATLRPLSLEFWHTPTGGELLISDAPAFTYRHASDTTPMTFNMAIGDSHGIGLPLTRDCFISIAPKTSENEMSTDQVDFFNEIQVRLARKYVYYRPGSNLGDFVHSTMRKWNRPESSESQ